MKGSIEATAPRPPLQHGSPSRIQFFKATEAISGDSRLGLCMSTLTVFMVH